MKTLFLAYPTVSRFVLAILLCGIALVSSDLIGSYIHFPFTGVILLTLSTWILFKTENKSLSQTGLTLQVKHWSFLFLGLLLGIASLGISTYSRTLYTGEQWHISSSIDWSKLLEGLLIVLPTVATQQLIFRGYAYTKTIQIANVLVANLIFGFLFVSYHDIWGDIIPTLFSTAALLLAHYVFASGLLRSGTLYFPIGIHWGHNWSSQYFADMKDSSKHIFYLTDQQTFNSWQAYVIFWITYCLGYILLALVLWKWNKISFAKA